MKNFALSLLLTLTLIGCANTVPIKPEQKANLHNIAIVSLLENELEFTKVGLTVFNNDYFTLDANDFDIDKKVEETIQNELKLSSPNINIIQVPFDKSELLKIYKSQDSWGEYSSISRIEPELKSKLSQSSADAVILVYKVNGQDPIANTSVFIKGYGIFYRSLPFVDPILKPYALYSIALLDSKTLKPITSKYVRGVSPEYGKMEISWEDQIKNGLTESMLKDFKSAISSVIINNSKTSLKEMGL